MPGESRLPPSVTVGGQAVLEGVMMRGPSAWAVALRTPAGEIAVHRFEHVPWVARHGLLRLPFVRGLVALAEALSIGGHALALSAAAARGTPAWGVPRAGLALALGLVIAGFFVAPAAVARGLGQGVLVEAAVRLALFLGYLALLARRPGMRRLLEYHGAEHKAVACHEAGRPLTPADAQGFPRVHPRCGTSFLGLVLIVACLILLPLGQLAWGWLLTTRALAAPVAAALAFELVRWAVRTRAQRLLAPLVALQRFTTREPDREQLRVAIAALQAVLAAGGTASEPAGLEVAA